MVLAILILWHASTVLGIAMTIRAFASRAELGSKFAVALTALAAAPGIAFAIETVLTPPGPNRQFVMDGLVMLWLLIGPVLVVASALVEPFARDKESFAFTRILNVLSWLLSTMLVGASA